MQIINAPKTQNTLIQDNVWTRVVDMIWRLECVMTTSPRRPGTRAPRWCSGARPAPRASRSWSRAGPCRCWWCPGPRGWTGWRRPAGTSPGCRSTGEPGERGSQTGRRMLLNNAGRNYTKLTRFWTRNVEKFMLQSVNQPTRRILVCVFVTFSFWFNWQEKGKSR